MRIAYFTECYDPFINGVVVLVRAFKQQLERLGHDVVVFAPSYPGQVDHDEPVVRLPSIVWSREGYPFLRPFSGVDAQFRRWDFDVIHSHHPFTCGMVAERLSREYDLPLVYTLHSMLTDYAHYVPLPRTLCEQSLLRVVQRHCARAHRITVSTNVMRSWLMDHGVSTPISIIPPNLPMPEPAPDARERIRADLGIPQAVPLLLYAGRLSVEKNLELLLRAAASSLANDAYRLVLVGEGPHREALEAEIEALGLRDRVSLVGLVDHERMGDWYAAADLFVFPSACETFGLVVLESMAAGLPVVAINLNGPSEIVEDGVTGFLTAPDEADFGAAMARLVQDGRLRAELGAAAQASWSAKWVDDSGARLVTTYEAARLTHAGSCGVGEAA